MITRPAPGPHTCLRCHRRLLRNAAALQFQIALSSTDSSPKADSENPDNSTSSKKGQPVQMRRTLVPLSEFTRSARKPFKEYRVVEEPVGQFYGFRGHKLFKELETLKVNKFGDPAEVIILRESKIRRYDAPEPSIKQQPPDQIDILARLNNERGLVSQTEVEENINEFRPKKGQEPKNWDEFNNLVRQLQDAFTNIQLEKYIDSSSGRSASGLPTESQANQASTDDNTLILQRSPWVPAYSDSSDYFEDASLRGYALPSHTAKQRIVVRLLRECWKLELPELTESIGQTEIRIRPGDLDLLLRDSIFYWVNKSILTDEGEKLEAFRSHGIIQITATEQKSNLVINEIEQVMKNIKRIKFSLLDLMPPPEAGKSRKPQNIRKWADSMFNDTILSELSRITNTNITRLTSTWSRGKEELPISISCLTSPNNMWLSNQANMAQRLLATTDDFSNRNQYQLACKKMPQEKSGFFVKHGSTDGLRWREKLREWTRWTVPIPKEAESQMSDPVQDQVNGTSNTSEKRISPTFDTLTPVDPTTAVNAPSEAEKEFDTGKYWSDTYKTESSAVFGEVLHCHGDSNPEVIPEKPWGANKSICTFSPSLPTLSPLLQEAQLPRYLRTDTLTLRFLPNPFYVDPQTKRSIGSGVLSAFPPLEMHFDVSLNDKDLQLRTVDAIVEESKTDLMLPDYAVDVRFHQKTTSRLRSRWLDLPEIQEFLKCSNLTWKDRRIDLPPTLKMQIANHLCKEPELKMLGRDTTAETHEVEYLFVGRETRSTLALGFQNWKLQYTSIDQGIGEGKRSELKLRPIKTTANGTEEEYLETVLDLADSFGSTQMFSARRVSEKNDLTKMLVMSREHSANPVQTLSTHISERFRSQFLERDDEDSENSIPEIDESEQSSHNLSSNGGIGHHLDTQGGASTPLQPTEDNELGSLESDLYTQHDEKATQPVINPNELETSQEDVNDNTLTRQSVEGTTVSSNEGEDDKAQQKDEGQS